MSTRILHVINDISADMRYGGPAMNCLRHSKFLESEDSAVTVWGSYSSTPLAFDGSSKIFCANKVYFPRYRFTFQFSISNVRSLFKAIKKSDIVHVHFAREINPVLASLISIFLHKKLILQTHGMIVQNPKLFYKVWDFLFTNRIFSRASVVLPLQKMEEKDLRKFPINRFLIVPNGIEVKDSFDNIEMRDGIVFMSRIHERKRADIFLESVNRIIDGGYIGSIGIYGEDAGYLPQLVELLRAKDELNWYKGGVSHQKAIDILAASELLILPSHHEPFPMVVLESLTLGTPVIIMSDCGIADTVAEIDPLFVCSSNPAEIAMKTFEIISKYRSVQLRSDLARNAREIFSIVRTIEGFNRAYAIATNGDLNAQSF
jgi:glycosyltransferase involved in cell wall biosynthesis